MHRVGDFLIGSLVVAGIFVLVRPRSQGPKLVDSITSGIVNLVKASTGGGSW